jgi:hypothetical protein
MESTSLKVSHTRGFDLKLRKADQVLHDTTQRFVENLYSNNPRITQFADPAFASKLLEKDTWYWLNPIEGAKVGYLISLPKQPILWMDEQMKYSYKIPMRVSHQIYEKGSVFIATLDRADGILRLEDIWYRAGENLRTLPFTKRWEALCEFYDMNYKPDLTLQQGLSIEPAKFSSLQTAESWANIPPMMYVQGEKAHRRLRILFQEQPKRQEPLLPTPPKFTNKPSFTFNNKTSTNNKININDENVAKAVAHEDYPDTYDIWIKGEKKGYAAVQDLDLSRQLRSASQKTKEINVKVEWNEEFNMYQIVSLV